MFKRVFVMFLSVSVVSPLSSAANTSNYYLQHAQGWYWYQVPFSPIKRRSHFPVQAQRDPIKRMDALHQRVNRALDNAFFNPTLSNVKQYMVLQDRVAKQAALFGARWRQVLLYTPQLDYAITHPTTAQARAIYLAKRYEKQERALAHVAKHDGLFFFYRSACPYCRRFAPILKAFAKRYRWRVIPVSLDAGVLAQFPKSRMDQGQAARLHVHSYPSLFAVNPKTKQITPLAYGFMPYEALRQRVLDSLTPFKGDV